jgi:hypothetical protein
MVTNYTNEVDYSNYSCNFCGASPEKGNKLLKYKCPECRREGCEICMPDGSYTCCPECDREMGYHND